MTRMFPLAALLLASAAYAAPADRSGVDLAGRDVKVAPGDDFDAYANGGWRAATEIPADRASTGSSYQTFLTVEQRNKDIIAGIGAANPAAGSDGRRIADYYGAYLNTAAIDAGGLAPAKPWLDRVAATKDKAALAALIGSTIRADTDPLNATNFWSENLFGVFVSQAPQDPSRPVAYLLQGGTGLPDRDYFLSDTAEMKTVRDAYRQYVVDYGALIGLSPARAAAVYELDAKIAAAQSSLTDSQDIHKAQVWTRAELEKNAPGIDWGAMLGTAGLGEQGSFVAWQPEAITRIAALYASEPLGTWQDWLAFHSLSQRASVLPKALDDRRFAFYGKTLSGIPQQRTREKRAIASVNAGLGDAVGKIYAERYFPASAKADVQAIVKNIIAAFDRRLVSIDWMSPATKAEARHKVQTLVVGVGYPDSWRDYSSLAIKSGDAFGNAWRAGEWEYRFQIAKLKQPIDRGEWWMTPQTVNAVNLPLQNALNFPAAILQAPLYHIGGDPAANYGAIGAVIGHEISHSFDNLGADFDAEGRLRNWWTKEDLARFEASGAALAAQYSAYEPLPGLHLNGKQVLGENIADVAGLQAAYDAYHASLNGKPAPVIDGLSGDQRFFLAFAQGWRTKTREAALRQQIATDVHAPAAQRAETVRNLDAWYQAYKVTPGQKLYLAPKDRVGVW